MIKEKSIQFKSEVVAWDSHALEFVFQIPCFVNQVFMYFSSYQNNFSLYLKFKKKPLESRIVSCVASAASASENNFCTGR